ncbi:cytochrome b/b6 domain-containing protein [Methylococcus sp. ANG]|nr:cytochrome b/b6 domain-containing protein [Methylococcus sp. Mc7]
MEIHRFLGWALAALVVGHVVMAIKHHHIDRDGVLKRMLPGQHPRAD